MYLTTTRLDRFWGDDEEILILGDWCEIESFTAAEKKRSKTLRYHWSNYNKKVIDAYRIYDSYEKISMKKKSEIANDIIDRVISQLN